MKKRQKIVNSIILIFLLLVSVLIIWEKPNIKVPKPKFTFEKKYPYIQISKNGYLINYTKNFPIKEGLDLQGGSNLTYSADLSKIDSANKKDAMNSLQKVIENRVNAFGVAEPLVYTTKVGNEDRLVVELAGIKDTEQALNLIGKTAQLQFKEAGNNDFTPTNLTGKDFKHAQVVFNQNTSAPEISIEFNAEGAKKFAEITGRNIGKPLAIFLDENMISAPTVNNAITDGKAVITGGFTLKEAKEIAIQLNAGSLPVPINLIEQRTIGATLGRDSVTKSLVAAVIGIVFVSVFMIIYYRFLGVFSTVGLALYIVFMFAIYKLFGVVLTMGGIAGLILSIGASMETDILVFERIREELRKGRSFAVAANLGFKRAWPSIKDSNIVSLIITIILYSAGGIIRGFAFGLGIGIIIGLLTTFLGTRTLINLFSNYRFAQNNLLYSVEKEA